MSNTSEFLTGLSTSRTGILNTDNPPEQGLLNKNTVTPHAGGVCPNCGYCPHCGRSAQPYYVPAPFYVPPFYPYVTCGDGSNYTAGTSIEIK